MEKPLGLRSSSMGIYAMFAGLLVLTTSGLAQPPLFTPTTIVPNVYTPVGVAATASLVIYSANFCGAPGSRFIYSIDTSGVATKFSPIPDPPATALVNGCGVENYLAISPGLGTFAAKPGYVYVSSAEPRPSGGFQGVIYEIPPSGCPNLACVVKFADIPTATGELQSLTFDTVGKFGYDLIVSGAQTGNFVRVNGAGTVSPVFANVGGLPEGHRVAPATWGPLAGDIFTAQEGASGNPLATGHIVTISPGGATSNFTPLEPTPEQLNFVPPTVCGFNIKGTSYSMFQAQYAPFPPLEPLPAVHNGYIAGWPTADFNGMQGNTLLMSSEYGNVIKRFNTSGTEVLPAFSTNGGFQVEQSDIVACLGRGGCPFTKGFWKNHPFPAGLFPTPSSTILIGCHLYTANDLLTILSTPPAGGNAVLIMGSQLVAAILNLANGAAFNQTVINAISQANSLLCANHINMTTDFVQSSTPLGQQLVNIGNILDAFNNGSFNLVSGCTD